MVFVQRFYPYFKDSVGAIDGTHVRTSVPLEIQGISCGRKDGTTQNVLVAVTFDLRFCYVLAGWEGNAHDSRVLADALSKPNGSIIPEVIMMGKSKVNDEKVKQFRWSKPMDCVLLEILANEARNGNKPSRAFKPSSIARVVNAINERFSVACEPDHVKNHLKTVKSNWKTIQVIRGKGGFNWDDKMKIFMAGKRDFDEYVTVHPSHGKYLNSMIDMYDEMALVVGRDLTTGNFAKQLRDIDVVEVDSSPVDLGNDFDELMNGSKTSSSTLPSEKRSHKRRRCLDNDEKYFLLATQLGEMASAIKSLGSSNDDFITKLYNEVMKMDGYDEVTLGSIFDYLVENEKNGKAFMVKSVNLRKVWIDKFLSKGEHN